MSSSPEEARSRVIDLYRGWIRAVRCSFYRMSPSDHTQAPEIVSLYAIPATPSYVRHCIRQKFEANRHVTDPRAIEVLIHKSRQDLQESLNCWKQTDHVMGILLKVDERPQRTFLQKFFEGTLY